MIHGRGTLLAKFDVESAYPIIHCIQGIIPGGSGSLFVGPCLGLKTH